MHSGVTSSGERSATVQITTTGGYLHSLQINPPSSGYATLKVYDSNNAGTTLLIATVAVSAGLNSIYLSLPHPQTANNGIYAVLTGTTTYTIGFSLG